MVVFGTAASKFTLVVSCSSASLFDDADPFVTTALTGLLDRVVVGKDKDSTAANAVGGKDLPSE
jgi:hypothetical protein